MPLPLLCFPAEKFSGKMKFLQVWKVIFSVLPVIQIKHSQVICKQQSGLLFSTIQHWLKYPQQGIGSTFVVISFEHLNNL